MKEPNLIIENLKAILEECTASEDAVSYVNSEDAGTLKAAIEALEKQEKDRWIPVTERLPEYEKEVLTCDDSGGMSVGYLYSPGFGHADRWHVDFTYSPVYHIVAWRPLPEPYTEEEA